MARRTDTALISRQLPVAVFFLLMVLCVLGGGSSRVDTQIQPLIWIMSITCCGSAFWFRSLVDFKPVRPVLIFLSLIAIVTAAQLVPLPPSLWSALPGRAIYAQTLTVTNIPLGWHAISLTPDLTWASLFAVLPAFATVLGFGSLAPKTAKYMLPFLLTAVVGSALLGLAQLSAGPQSALRFYPITNSESAVGFFANRNHNALFLVLGLPMLTVWARLDPGDQRRANVHYWVAIVGAFFLVPMIIVTGSRAGVILGVLALGGSYLLARSGLPKAGTSPHPRARPLLINMVPITLVALITAGLIFLSRAAVITRLFATNVVEEQRGQMLSPLWRMLVEFFPFGSGFGSFDPVYRAFEPFDLLNTSFMNHAHNDLLHIIIEGGLPAALLLLSYLGWWAVRARALWATPARLSSAQLMGRLGTVMSLLMLLASLADYPLRMPLLGVVFMIATLWMIKVPARG